MSLPDCAATDTAGEENYFEPRINRPVNPTTRSSALQTTGRVKKQRPAKHRWPATAN
jgi:hypothetical protein